MQEAVRASGAPLGDHINARARLKTTLSDSDGCASSF
jgi:hypothetical protein